MIDGFEYTAKSVVDDMPKSAKIDDITKMFYAVGFGSVPSWLKPYSVLSNGEKMRVDLARAMLERDFVVFDEFTSVVDRNVAKTACIAINKAIKKTGKKFYGCTNYPDCDFAAPGVPTGDKCPECGGFIISGFKGRKFCMNGDCPTRKAQPKKTTKKSTKNNKRESQLSERI